VSKDRRTSTYPEDGGATTLRNVVNYLSIDTA